MVIGQSCRGRCGRGLMPREKNTLRSRLSAQRKNRDERAVVAVCKNPFALGPGFAFALLTTSIPHVLYSLAGSLIRSVISHSRAESSFDSSFPMIIFPSGKKTQKNTRGISPVCFSAGLQSARSVSGHFLSEKSKRFNCQNISLIVSGNPGRCSVGSIFVDQTIFLVLKLFRDKCAWPYANCICFRFFGNFQRPAYFFPAHIVIFFHLIHPFVLKRSSNSLEISRKSSCFHCACQYLQ